jgi:tetratricopeptide (TPR) repeat protein/fibronectin type 3 domain-containing protein
MKNRRRALFILALALCVGILASAYSLAQVSAYDYILRGEQYLAQGLEDEAIRQFEQAVQIEPTNTRAHFGLGRAYEARSNAARVFNYRMELVTEPEPIRKLGFPPLSEQGYQDMELAIQAYSKAASYSPPYIEGYYRQGVLYFVSGRSQDARAALERAVAHDRAAVDPAILLAYIYLDEGNGQAAATQIDQTISATGDRYNPVILGALAALEYRNGRYYEAEQLLLQALGRQGVPAYLHKRLGDAAAARGAHTQALDAYRQAAAQGGAELVLSNDALGNIYRLSGQPAQAMQYYSAAASANPNLVRAKYGLGSACLEAGSYAQALQIFSELAEAVPVYGFDNAVLLKGIAQWRTGNHNAALTSINTALGINPANRIADIYKERIEREMASFGISPAGVTPRAISVEGRKPDKPFSGVLINDGAKYTNSRTVRLGVYSDYSTVAFSNDNYTWSTWFSKPDSYGEFTWELPPGDGTKRVYVKFRGLFGIGISGESGTITLDATPPTATARLETMQTGTYGGYDSRTRVVLSADDPSGVVGFWISYDGDDWRWFDWYGTDFALALPSGAGLAPRVYFSVVDGAGNHAPIEALVSTPPPADTQPPRIHGVQAAQGAFNTAVVTWTTDEPADSYVEYWAYGVPQNKVGTSAYTTSHSVTLTNLRASTTYYYRVVSTDAAGNRGQSQDLMFVVEASDTTPPVISRVQATTAGRDSVSITWTTDEPADSYVEYWAYGVLQNKVGASVRSTYHAVTLSSLRSGVTYYYIVTSTDAAGNKAQSSQMSFRVEPPLDTTPPTVRLQINRGAQYTNSRKVQLEIVAQDDSGGPLEMRIWDDKSSWGPWMAYSDSATWELTLGDGRRTVYVKVRDAAGNEAQAQAVITLDTVRPRISSVQTREIGPDSAVITWRTDEASDSWAFYGIYSPNLVKGQYDSVTTHTVALVGLSPNTNYYFKVRSTDAAGNMAESSTMTFRTSQIGDKNPPTGSITINDGARYTRYYDVRLSIAARDDSPGPIEMRLREGTGTWSGWMLVQQSMTFRISPGDGSKTVYAEFRDIYGNQSRSYSASIILDTRPARITNVKTTNITANSATIAWNTDEPATSTVEYGLTGTTMRDVAGDKSVASSEALSPAGDVGARAVIITPVVPSGSLRTSHSVTLTGLREKTKYYFQVVSKDAAGNVAVASGFSFTTGSGTVPPPPPPPPTGKVNVNWAAAANGGRASASSYAPASSDGPARPASLAIDGNMKTYWESSTRTSTAQPQWLMVQFGGPQTINFIRISSEGTHYPMDITVEVEKNGLWVAVASFKSTSEARKYIKVTKEAVSFEFELDPVVATAIRLTVKRVSNPSHPIQFYEVEALNTGR